MTQQELKEIIKKIHALWYNERNGIFENERIFIRFHEYLSELFNFAGIESSHVENNPNEVSPDDFKKQFRIYES